MKKKIINSIYYIWIISFVIAPLALVVITSFKDIYGNFTIANYQVFASEIYLRLTFNSFILASLITITCLFFAYLTVIFLTQTKHARLFLILIILPSWINILLKTYAFMGIMGSHGIINKILEMISLNPVELLFNIKGFLIVAIYIFIPFMIYPLYNAVEQIDKSYFNAARDLGASNWQILRKIMIPLSKEGIFTAIQITFIPSLSLFMITRLIAGNRVITLGTAIEQHFMVTGNWPMGSAIGTVLIMILIIMMIVSTKLTRKGVKHGN